jgi:hypothetical protein
MTVATISIPDVNCALPQALPLLLASGRRITANSLANQRPTIEWPGVFVTEYTSPQRNVLFDETRDANPFFHFLETMWILAGRNDVKFLQHLLPKMGEYSDNTKTFHGAYGYRLRRHWATPEGDHDLDQVEQAIKLLDAKPNSRQVVMSIWDPREDLGATTKDVPCNDMIMCKVREGRLNLTVNNRSNDAILGCYGANVVQFSMLQMYMAARLNVGVGIYTQVSDSFHVYEDDKYWNHFLAEYHGNRKGYLETCEASEAHYRRLGTANLFAHKAGQIDRELAGFFEVIDTEDMPAKIDPFPFETTAVHDAACVWNALHAYRNRRYDAARTYIDDMRASDWQLGCDLWVARRERKNRDK